MGSRTFTLTASVASPAERVIDFLAALDRHRGLHPYLVSATVTDRSVGPAGPVTAWSVHERPRLGPLRYSLRFPVLVVRTSAVSLRSEVRAAPRCRLDVAITASEGADGRTALHEECTVEAPWFLLGHAARGAREAHAQTFRRLPEALEEGP